jgi:hypothetical protein
VERKKKLTKDHLLILNEIARERKKKKTTLYRVFLDVTNALDKA